MLNKRGVVSVTTFSLIILILFIILGFSYTYYSDSKHETNLIIKQEELLYSLGSFRSEITNMLTYDNTNLTYKNNLDSADIELILINTSIKARTIYNKELVKKNISNLGIEFCNTYTISPASNTNLHYNGSCISITN